MSDNEYQTNRELDKEKTGPYQDAAELLHNADWDNIIPRLLLYTVNIMRKRNKPHEEDTSNKIEVAQDFVMEAITQVLDGRKQWYPNKNSLFSFLAGVITSNVVHSTFKKNFRQLDYSVNELQTTDDVFTEIEQSNELKKFVTTQRKFIYEEKSPGKVRQRSLKHEHHRLGCTHSLLTACR